MMAMQYSVRLPDGFDPAKLHARVAERSVLFDNLAGLQHKSFLFDERERIYAPLYIWRDHDAARRYFLEDKMFESVVQTFGRPRVRRWMVLDMAHGTASEKPRIARCEFDKAESNVNLRSLIDREGELHRAALQTPGLFTHMVALDADRWEIVRYSLWNTVAAAPKSEADCVQDYQVLHVSEPKAA